MATFPEIRFRFVAAVLVVALGALVAVAGQASHSRPGGGSSGGSGGTTATRGGGGTGGGSGTTIHASGHATWGYGGAGHGGGYYPGWGWGWGWGWPYYYPYGGWYGGWYGAYGPAWYGPPRGATWVFTGDLSRFPGAVETRVKPKSARVLLDGRDVGRAKDYNGSWDRLSVPPGRHTLEFTRDGYQTLRVDVDVRGGQSLRIERELQKGEGQDPGSVVFATPPPVDDVPATAGLAPGRGAPAPPAGDAPSPALRRGLLRIDVEPGDAAVYLDGQYLARAEELARLHGALPVAAGSHRVEVVRPGYAGQAVDVEVAEGDLGRVELVLQESR